MRSDAARIDVGSVDLASVEVGGFRVTDARFPAHLALATHYHARPCLAIVLEGAVEKTFARVGYTAAAASVLTMPAEETHRDRFKGTGAHMLVVEPSAGTDELLRPYARLFECEHRRDAGGAGLGWRLARELKAPDAVSPLAIHGLVLELLAYLGRRDCAPVTARRPAWLATAEEYLHARFAEPVDAAGLAATVGVHPVYLARVFRAHYGMSMGDYIRRLRLEWAADQLARSSVPLAEVAAHAGFVDQSHFTRAFKHYLGVTPGQYRLATRRL
jgi:AraC family transcriptional regulator